MWQLRQWIRLSPVISVLRPTKLWLIRGREQKPFISSFCARGNCIRKSTMRPWRLQWDSLSTRKNYPLERSIVSWSLHACLMDAGEIAPRPSLSLRGSNHWPLNRGNSMRIWPSNSLEGIHLRISRNKNSSVPSLAAKPSSLNLTLTAESAEVISHLA